MCHEAIFVVSSIVTKERGASVQGGLKRDLGQDAGGCPSDVI
jgi:hypothetical protein